MFLIAFQNEFVINKYSFVYNIPLFLLIISKYVVARKKEEISIIGTLNDRDQKNT